MTPGKLLGHPLQVIGAWLAARPGLQRWLRVLRLGLFQFGMGVSLAPITGTLNRVLIDELRIPAVAVGFLISLHYFVSPARAMVGFRSDVDRAAGNWRTPYLVFGALLTYGGLATAPFSLILLSGDGALTFPVAMLVCTLIFLAYGIGVNVVETIYLATVSDITPANERGKVLGVLWIMLVLGTIFSSIVMGQLLINYNHIVLIQVMQGSAVIFIALAFVAMFHQERLKPNGDLEDVPDPIRVRETLGQSLRLLARQAPLRNLFIVLFIATLGFATHDVLLEPYGGQVLGMTITQTTRLTALWGVGMLLGIIGAAVMLWKGRSPVLLISLGCLLGAGGFLAVTLASETGQVNLFRTGATLIGAGRGSFIVGALALVMGLVDRNHAGLFIGLWGITQALAQGFGTIGGGLGRDIVQYLTGNVALGYTAVYATSLSLLVLSISLLLGLRIGSQVRNGAVRSPWAGLDQANVDQILF
ncbi:BCD family MFS transporter [Candidatus Chloroploca sp. M-50]|uniref:BCD family MFS transporter n=1 Tax=Candidatus Chloroploca mongolica TaxID=2528176 RepID=A0ABS4DG99_9CHLR|nr:BCD family MFS transporter [Candidatus Chloroploca mongolica]MBP1468472.1 BCD family MFS transporter [Candidatus Chloroploca mongolica]